MEKIITPVYATDPEAKEQLHALACGVHGVEFNKRTLNTCTCTRREVYVKQFSFRRPAINLR